MAKSKLPRLQLQPLFSTGHDQERYSANALERIKASTNARRALDARQLSQQSFKNPPTRSKIATPNVRAAS